MATIIRMPEVAANATHATLVSWSKKEGDKLLSGESIADVETEKAVIELNIEVEGTVARLLVKNGDEVAVGAPVAVLINAGETTADADRLLQSESGEQSKASTTEFSLNTVPSVTSAASSDVSSVQLSARIFSSPVARLLARQHNIDLGAIAGSGPNGRIIKYDVQQAIELGRGAKGAISSSSKVLQTIHPVVSAGFTDIPHTNMRRTIARRLHESKSTVPHFYLTVECRVDKLMQMRVEINAQSGSKISVNDFVLLACARALREIPTVNVAWTESSIRQFDEVDISVAVSTDAGLITPILRNVNAKSLSGISQEVRILADRARQGRLRPEEFQGGSFSVSNLGMYGVDEFAAIINPPQAAILAVGAVKAQPVINQAGAIEAGQVMRCTLSVDHRAVDGALAAQWLSAFRRYIESPYLMLV